MKTGKVLLSTFALFLALAVSAAADIQIAASLDRQQIALNEQAVLNVTITGNTSSLPDPQMPALPKFRIDNAGTSQNYSWVNGQTTASVTHRYVLTPQEVGQFTIPSIQVSAGGQTAAAASLSLEVVKGNAAALPPGAAPTPAHATANAPSLFITATVDKAAVFVGEPVTLSFRLYRQIPLLSQPQYQPPSTAGFWLEDLPPQRNYRTNVKGATYDATEVKTALFPTGPGKATIGPAALRVAIQNFSGDPGDLFSNFFGGAQEKVLQTEPITVTVKSLPDPKPSGFKGAVGHYDLSASLDKTSTSVGQPVTLTVTVSGEGNIKSLPDIAVPTITNVRVFDTTAATNIDKKEYRVSGSKVFKTILVPQVSGNVQVPSVSFVYFDTETHTYKTRSSKSFVLSVKPAPPGSAVPTFAPSQTASASTPNVQVLGEDIRYIKTPPTLTSSGKPLYRNKLWLALNGVAFLLFLGSALFTLYRWLFLSDAKRLRFKQALRVAERAITADGTAGNLSDAFRNYLAAKLDAHATGISLQDAAAQLQAANVRPEEVQKARELWETLDLYQFAPAQVKPEDLRKASEALRRLLEQLDEEIRWAD